MYSLNPQKKKKILMTEHLCRIANPKITFTMCEVMKNQQLIGMYSCEPFQTIIHHSLVLSGSTMGSHQYLIDATNFLPEHHIVLVVSHIFNGLESAEQGFEIMQHAAQFGKIVIKMPANVPGHWAKL
jgi:D-arabinose 1-dehydrogenase-like Zn-dependent alcohol dehydrogenase